MNALLQGCTTWKEEVPWLGQPVSAQSPFPFLLHWVTWSSELRRLSQKHSSVSFTSTVGSKVFSYPPIRIFVISLDSLKVFTSDVHTPTPDSDSKINVLDFWSQMVLRVQLVFTESTDALALVRGTAHTAT